MIVVLVGLDGIHIGEFEVEAETPPKLVKVLERGRAGDLLEWKARSFVLRTGNYYDEVVPLHAKPAGRITNPPKV